MGWKEEAASRVKEAGQGNSIVLEQGENTLRILPNKNPKKAPYKTFWQHELGPQGKTRRVACGKDAKGNGECWACDVKLPELNESASASKRELAKNGKRKEVMILWASKVNQDTGKFAKAKKWWLKLGGSKSMGVKILSLLSSSKHHYEDPIKGRNITVTRTGTGLQTEYPSILPDDEPSKVPSAILSALESLDEAVPAYDEQEMKDAYFGRERKESVKSQPKGKAKKRHEEEEVEEEDEDEVEDDEVEEDEEVDEEESEDDDEEVEDDEDEAEDEESEDEDEESEDEEYDADEDEPSEDEDEEEESEDEEEVEDEEEEPEPPKRSKKPVKKAPAKKVPAKKASPKPAKKLPAKKVVKKTGKRK